ncbi:putative disease resistance protein At5g66900 [Castanea sativa]|uniref:putative disease resistance protein At5g66900 n=1 Tax=Castanea sativa TaxID=21020 RepID=UPI003F64CD49
MALAFVGGALLGALFGEAFAELRDAVKHFRNKGRKFNSTLEKLESNLENLEPVVKVIKQLSEELDGRKDEIQRLIDQMKKAGECIRECLKIKRWQRPFKTKYGGELNKLNEAIESFCKVDMQVHIRRDVLELKKIWFEKKAVGAGVLCSVPPPPKFIVGLDVPLKELKTMLLKEGKEESLLLVTAPGGCGKTTLVIKLSQDKDIEGKFGKNIFFAVISKNPDLKDTVQKLFHHVGLMPHFQSDEDAVNHLQQLPKQIGSNPILLILDDVWPGSETLLEKFELHMPDSKILVTSRTAFPRFSFTYELKPLNDLDAMTLFRHSASLQDRSSCIADENIKKMLKGCGGFPLALEVIGGSLRGQRAEVQLSRVRKWSNDDIISNPDVYKCLQRSLEFSDPKVKFKECFTDLGSFPEDQRTYAAALIDMWAELYNLDEDGVDAIAILQELAIRHLASLVMTRKDGSEFSRYYNDDFVTQHDLLRELAISESKQEPIEKMQRLIMDIRENALPLWCTQQNQQPTNARLISISTDKLFTSSWCNIQAPNVEVLVLNFQSKIYSLPECVEKMDKLKAVIITNYDFFPAELINFQLLKSPSNLKRIRLERVSIPSLFKAPLWLRSLKKLSLFMCSFGLAFGNSTMKVKDALPNLMEINIDYCNDLVELPAWLCDVILLEKLSITNCHHLSALPKEIKMLENLIVLRLRSCTELSELPDSIKCLQKLRFLDISDCLGIRNLPKDIGELRNLEELHMKGYLNLNLRNGLPQSTEKLKQLKLVICDDEERAKLWEPFKEVLTNLEVRKVEKEISLSWL